MAKQERKFTLAEAHTKTGTMGEVRFDQTLLDILGVKPGDFLVFTISTEGEVTVKGEKKAAHTIPAKSAAIHPGVAGAPPVEVTQPALFDAGQQVSRPARQGRRTR